MEENLKVNFQKDSAEIHLGLNVQKKKTHTH